MADARYYVVGDRSSSQSMPHKSSACGASAPMCVWWKMTAASNDASGRDTPASRPRCRSWASCSTTMTRVRAPRRWWLRNLAGKGTPPAELKSLSAQGDPAVSPRVAGMLHRHAAHDPRPFDKRGAIVLQQKCSRAQVEAWFINMPPCLTLRPARLGRTLPAS
jgi:hypothetical protein